MLGNMETGRYGPMNMAAVLLFMDEYEALRRPGVSSSVSTA